MSNVRKANSTGDWMQQGCLSLVDWESRRRNSWLERLSTVFKSSALGEQYITTAEKINHGIILPLIFYSMGHRYPSRSPRVNCCVIRTSKRSLHRCRQEPTSHWMRNKSIICMKTSIKSWEHLHLTFDLAPLRTRCPRGSPRRLIVMLYFDYWWIDRVMEDDVPQTLLIRRPSKSRGRCKSNECIVWNIK